MSEHLPGTEEGVRGHEAGDINQIPRSTFWVFAYLGYGLGGGVCVLTGVGVVV